MPAFTLKTGAKERKKKTGTKEQSKSERPGGGSQNSHSKRKTIPWMKVKI